MSCPNSNAPIDISIQKISGKCDLKCAYNYKYPNSSCTATNRGDYISLSYDSTSTSPVTYNAVGYNVQEVRLYTPSLHTFNGSHAVAEIIIIHVSNKGTKPLLVCVPVTEGNSSSDGNAILGNIISVMAKSAPAEGETANVNIDNFTMDSFVPKKPYFSYTAIQPYQPCIGDVDLIVFTPLMAKCTISSESLNKLNTIISNNDYTIKTGPLLFFNEKGPGSAGVGDEIYIDCKPINKSVEETMITQSVSVGNGESSSVDMNSILESPAFQILVSSLLFILILFVFNMITKMFSGGGSNKVGGTFSVTNK